MGRSKNMTKQSRDVLGGFVDFASAEWMLKRRSNGGTVILMRSIWVSALLFGAYIWAKEVLHPERVGWSFSGTALAAVLRESLEAFGAILAFVYLAFYTRFASQWGYLAGLYNELVKTSLEIAELPSDKEHAMAWWKAAFIEDAADLHLATKRIFAPAVKDWLQEPQVRECFLKGAFGGAERLKRLEAELRRLIPDETAEQPSSVAGT